MTSRRLLLVHAHPDDEVITTGATMAYYAAHGADVTLLTCTLGEEGEVLVPEYALLAAGEADQLGGFRIGELAAALSALGVTDHRWLGGAGRFRDSGMMDTPSNKNPRAFWRADEDEAVFESAVSAAVGVVRDVRPQVVVTYDERGTYGHPDHIMAHRVAMAAVERAGDPAYGTGEPWQVAKVYWICVPKSQIRRSYEALSAIEDRPFDAADPDELPFGVGDELITSVIDATGFGEQKLTALAAHRTQVAVDAPWFALSNMLGQEILAVEHYTLVRGALGPDRDERGWETDLFSGIAS